MITRDSKLGGMSDAEKAGIAALVEGPCPFCRATGGQVIADFDGRFVGEPALLHSVPACADYTRMSGDEFVDAVIGRRHLS